MVPFIKPLRGMILIKYEFAKGVQSILGLFFLLFLSYSSTCQVNFKSLSEFPAYKLTSSQGKIFTSTMATKAQKPTVVVYFSPTCNHCQTQTTDITSNMGLFKGVQFLFVTAYPANDTKPFLNDYAIEKFDNILFGYDSTFAMGRFFELKSLPGIFIYDKDKQLKAYFETNVKAEKLYSAIFEAKK